MVTATTASVTLEKFARLREDDRYFELSEGELVEVTFPTASHTLIAKHIAKALEEAGAADGVGEAFIEAGFLLQQEPPILRRPDVALITNSHLAQTSLGQWFEGAPAIAVEVVSPTETASALNPKIRQYLRGGATVVMTAYPQSREIHLHRRAASIQALMRADAVAIPDPLPNWSRPVADLLP